ncbi:MAG: DNA polymerase III subunit beta [Candidatus Terrybacteria bacterium RIFCSPHIGHO2_01_FULL_58_15]|uniref:Beta sliding clamp n=1 Tax=Terrybacteria sp. (strain RIFCSPHIGHO2_01_FULL_58_15) TaxID=1802363 RepID=A0A1G2PNZ2_TERXR|nr:MAG: DNA polymerase III subunit beta [Candidatus Terrybacteria bacterium RIFCSPHIGHO2_01_FULL_58_15]
MTCTRENLLYGLSLVERAIGRSASLPILSHVALKSQTGKITFSATDLDIAVVVSVPAKVDGSGSWAVPYRPLAGFVGALPEETVQLKPGGKALVVKSGAFQGKIRTGDAEEFPIIPQLKQAEKVSLPKSGFSEALEAALVAVAASETRPELTGVAVIGEANTVTVVATDTFRLAVRTLPYEGENPFAIILPQRTAQEVIRLFKESRENEEKREEGTDRGFTFKITEHQCLFEDGGLSLTSRLLEGSFPDFRAIIPRSAAAQVRLSRRELTRRLEAATFFTGRLNDVHITLQKEGGGITIAAENPDVGAYETSLEGEEGKGEEQTVAFNLRYFLDGLRGFSDEDVVLEFNGEQKPLLIRPAQGRSGNLYLLMPIRTS